MKNTNVTPIIGGLVLAGLLTRIFAGRKLRHRIPYFADKIRNMSEEEYEKFKQRFDERRCMHHHRWSHL